jgi:Tol biopolymer transport system component/tRNA A-37 threonylcarbamoyl transferase component Bud32
MTPERWQQIKALLESALERPPPERSAFLDRACAGDSALRLQVQTLIDSHAKAGDFIESPAYEVMAGSLAETNLVPGYRIGPYQIVRRLASGGMGDIYLAEDTRLGRKIVLKALPGHFTRDPERVRRFQLEARAASALSHPNIITIYEIGQIDQLHYIAIEYIDGETLRQRMTTATLKISEALEVAINVASALSAAHEAGIVHRDIKPENIMLRAGSMVKVLDFGLAKLTESKPVTSGAITTFQTEQGIVMGTAPYMSPEQARGIAVDGRTDIWSLGAVLYEMVGGHAPFEGPTSSDVIVSILDREPFPLVRHRPEVPTELEWIIKKALRKDRDDRYQTAKEFQADLKALIQRLEFEQELERSQDTTETRIFPTNSGSGGVATRSELRTARSTRARLGRSALIGGLAVLLLGLGYVLVKFLGSRTANNLAGVNFEQLTFQSGPEFFPSLSPDGKSIAYASRASGNWDIYLQTLGGGNAINLTKTSSFDDSQPAFSPDGERIAFRSEREGGGIYVMRADGESPARVSDFGYSPSWSADGRQILVGTEKIPQPSTRPTKSQLWTIDLNTGQRKRISEGDALQPTLSPNMKRIAYWSRPDRYGQREHILTVPVGGGDAVAVTDGSSTDLNPVWSPDGQYLYFSSNRGGSSNIWRVGIDENTGVTSGRPEAVTAIGANTSVLHLSFSRNGKQMAYSAQTEIRNLRSVPFDPDQGTAGNPRAVTQGSLQLWFPDISPDGEWLTAYSMGQQRHIYVIRTDGTEQRDLTPDNFRHAWPRWSPDGQRIAFTSRRTGDYELWVMNRDGSGLRQLTQSSGGHYSPWSANGEMVAYSIHTPRNDCVIINPDKSWSEQKLIYLSALSDATISFEGWSWSVDGKKLAGIRHLPNGLHSGIGIYDLQSKTYEWLTDFGDWPIWLDDNRRLLFVSQGSLLLYDTQSRKYQKVFVVTDQDVDIGSPALSRDNRTIYFTYVAAEADIWLMDLK